MAASVYATPPPDLSGEDTVLSDVSNSSQTNSSNNSQSKKRALSATSFLSTSTSPSNVTQCTSVIADALESKKRRKQTTPIRISATAGSEPISMVGAVNSEEINIKNVKVPSPDMQETKDAFEKSSKIIDAEEAIKSLKKQEDEQDSVKCSTLIKKEMIEWDGEIKRKLFTKPEDWLQLAGLPFPFSPDSTPYIPQLQLLGVPPVPSFNGDGSQRSNMPRIFNPEAYCELCNKEFCNKYFLKTHKANKHGIYEPPASNSDLTPVNLSQMQISQILFQQQQQQTQQQQEQQQQLPLLQNQQQPAQDAQKSVVEPIVYCDVCFKKFNSIFAMRKHKVKVHDQKMDDNGHEEVIKLPEGFREDYSVEQEDVSFTPQPRRMSPVSIQQARDANFSVDKLRHLGVINPEAFCELCGKEYCNKYFLRTHKFKRHGIIPPPDELKEDRPVWHTIQTSPLNLIMGDPQLSKDNIKEELKEKGGSDEANVSPKNVNQNDSEAISVDLQKLQSMILQLNDLNAQQAVSCNICNKELENHYLLHTHMLAEHTLENNNQNMSDVEACRHCEKEFPNAFLLKQHISEVHRDLSPHREGFVTPERPTMGANMTQLSNERRASYTITPTSSYCEICNKELCNKYFMKTHMQRMHGIEIENGAQIGGVVCNICNKELCSKYFLRVHKHNTHGIVDDGSPLPQSRSQSNDSLDGESFVASNSVALPDSLLKPGEVSDNRYFSHFTEVCSLCNRRFRSTKWLKAHLMSDHGKAGTDKLKELEAKQTNFIKPSSPALKIPNGNFGLSSPDHSVLSKSALSLFSENGPTKFLFNQDNPTSSSNVKGYQCSYCSFSTPILPFLFIHERSHSSMISNQTDLPGPLKQDRFQNQPLSNTPSDTTNSTPGSSTPVPAQEPTIKSPELNILTEMANLTQRPAVYALPQEIGPYIMQSFFLEEKSDDTRFVPAVVFLPVKERIMSSVNVSFTLTPA